MKRTILLLVVMSFSVVASAQKPQNTPEAHWNSALSYHGLGDVSKMKKECRAFADQEIAKLDPVQNEATNNLGIKFYMLCVEEWFIANPDVYSNHF